MEGLEISIIDFQTYQQSYRNRLDSEYYLKFLLNNENYLQGKPLRIYLKKETVINIKSLKLKKDFNYLSISGVHLKGLDYTTEVIDCSTIPDRATYCLKENDIVVSTVRPNRNAVAFIRNSKRLVGTSGFAVLRIDKKLINPYFVYSFLKTKFFTTKMMRENTATMYPAITDHDVLNVKIPLFSQTFQLQIEKLVKQAHHKLDTSKTLYREAEALLLEEVGLKDFTPSQEKVSVKNFSESFGTSGRLDAEYYQPKYEELEKKIKSYSNGYLKLGEISKISNGSLIDKEYYVEDSKRAYIRIKELSKSGFINQEQIIYIDDKFIHTNETIVQENEFIIATIGDTIGKSNRIPKELNHSFISNNTSKLCLLGNTFNPLFFEVLLHSLLFQEQINKYKTQTGQPKIRNEDIENFILPIIKKETQTQTAKKIEQSFALKKESERLLEVAKQAVEVAIEEGEDAGLEFIEQQSNE